MLDTLTVARRLKSACFSDAQAETLAGASRDSILAEIASEADIAGLARDIDLVRKDMGRIRKDLETEIALARKDLKTGIDRVRTDLDAEIEAMGMKLAIRLGVMIAGAAGALAAVPRLH